MSNKTPILLFGATGYIGGALLARLLLRPDISASDIILYLRNADKAKILEQKFGFKTVIGNNDELDKITAVTERAQVIFQVANADDGPFTEAMLRGMKQRHAKTGVAPIFFYTSGTGLLIDDARGEYASETIYDDLNVEQLKSIPPSALHRNVERLAIDADTEGYTRTYIVAPSLVWGIAQNTLVDAGVSGRQSRQIPILVKAALGRKKAGYVGKGKAYWPNVHVDDTADLYMVLFDSTFTQPEKTGHGWEGMYFAENGELPWLELGKACGEALVALGVASDPEPTPFTIEDFHKYFVLFDYDREFLGWYFGTNARCKANRARSIGWKPKYTEQDCLKSVKPEMELIMTQQ